MSVIKTAKKWKKFNANHLVKVKLTDFGHEILRERNESLNRYLKSINAEALEYTPRVEDEEGWSTWQLWELMHCLGEHVDWGSKNPFEMEMEIEIEIEENAE